MINRLFVLWGVAALLALNLMACGNASSAPRSTTVAAPVSAVEPTATAAPMHIKAEEICGLIRAEEAEELFGRPFRKPPVPSESNCCFWLEGGGGVRIENIKRPHKSLNGFTGGTLARELATWMASVGSEGVLMDDVADGAVQGPKLERFAVLIVRGPHLFRVETVGDFKGNTAAVLAAVARKIGPRLNQLNGRPL
jgi:hypothetical protein